MHDFDVLWAGWRLDYVSGVVGESHPGIVQQGCVMCALASVEVPSPENGVIWSSELVTVALNAYPYASGHLLVIPKRHTADLTTLEGEEPMQLFAACVDAIAAIETSYSPDAVNFGANLGRAAGAGIPEHLHFHALPRWAGDTNFMTSIAGARVIPEALDVSWARLHDAWPTRPAKPAKGPIGQ
ncbi:MAG: HIT family protein [Acidimicrobiales bacterium]